jgi:hypothetical protein
MAYQSAAIFITGLLTGAVVHFLTYLKGQPTGSNIYSFLLGTSLYSSLVGPFFFLPTGWWMRIKTYRPGRR